MKAFISFSLLLCFTFLSAQTTFKEGYYINKSNDTILGLIKDRDWNNTPKEIVFKSNELSSEIKLKPEETIAFEIFDKVKFISANVNYDVSSDNFTRLNSNRLPEYQNLHLFLKVLEEGQASLYIVQTDYNRRFFFKTDREELQMLIFKNYLDENSKVRENNNFRQQLLNSLTEGNLPQTAFKDLKYSARDLRKLVSRYNSETSGSTYSYKRKKREHSFFLTIRPGLQSSKVYSNTIFDNKTNFDRETNLRLGLELEYVLPFGNNKWSAILEPTYQSYSSSDEQNVQNILTLTKTIEYTSIEIPFGMRYYMFLNSKIQLFLNAGIMYEIGIGDNKIDGTRGFETDLNAFITPFAGLGMRYNKKFSLEFRQTFDKKLLYKTSVNYDYAFISSSSLVIGYRIL